MDTRSGAAAAIMAGMTDLVINARREGTRELLLTSGLIVVYSGLRGMAWALGALESLVP
jgi:hypothetical protein